MFIINQFSVCITHFHESFSQFHKVVRSKTQLKHHSLLDHQIVNTYKPFSTNFSSRNTNPRFTTKISQTLRPRVFRPKSTKSCRIPFNLNGVPSVAPVAQHIAPCAWIFRVHASLRAGCSRSTKSQSRRFGKFLTHIHAPCTSRAHQTQDTARVRLIIVRNFIVTESTGHTGHIDRNQVV